MDVESRLEEASRGDLFFLEGRIEFLLDGWGPSGSFVQKLGLLRDQPAPHYRERRKKATIVNKTKSPDRLKLGITRMKSKFQVPN